MISKAPQKSGLTLTLISAPRNLVGHVRQTENLSCLVNHMNLIQSEEIRTRFFVENRST